MLPTHSQIAEPLTSSHGRLGTVARPVQLVPASSGRATETYGQSLASVEDIVRREADFASAGDMTREERHEHITGAGMVFATVGVTAILIALVATATVLIVRWFA